MYKKDRTKAKYMWITKTMKTINLLEPITSTEYSTYSSMEFECNCQSKVRTCKTRSVQLPKSVLLHKLCEVSMLSCHTWQAADSRSPEMSLPIGLLCLYLCGLLLEFQPDIFSDAHMNTWLCERSCESSFWKVTCDLSWLNVMAPLRARQKLWQVEWVPKQQHQQIRT